MNREQALTLLAIMLGEFMIMVAFAIWQQSRGYKQGHLDGYYKGLGDYADALAQRKAEEEDPVTLVQANPRDTQTTT